MRTRLLLVAALCAAASPWAGAAPALVSVDTAQFTDRPIPRFLVDAAWPTMPADLMVGQVPGLSVDSDDNVWILQRPNSLGFSDTGLAQNPPIALCCKPAPHVMQFSSDGDLLRAWGGPSHAPTIDGTNQWPANVHGLYVGDGDSVWIAGNGDGDHVALNFTKVGEYVRMVGLRNASGGNFDKNTLGGPADIAPLPGRDEVLIADGYINKRIIGFDSEGRFTRYWGAYGASPDAKTRDGAFDQSQASSNSDGGANAVADTFGDIVHCVVRGPDDRIYVCDRRNNRVQIFETGNDGATTFFKDIVIQESTGGTRTASDIAFSPDGKFMYIADMMNGQVWIYDARAYELLGAIGRNGRYPGQFIWLHSVDVDSHGNVYTTEVSTGRRVQKFVFQGVK
ncbi:MAG: beta-propeller fold lactonase family protein [Pseudomonadota bacterium]